MTDKDEYYFCSIIAKVYRYISTKIIEKEKRGSETFVDKITISPLENLTIKIPNDIFSLLSIFLLKGDSGMKPNIDCDIRMGIDKVASQMRRHYSESLRELNLYVGQDNLLQRLWAGDGLTQMQLGECLKCEPPTISNMVKSLEQNGFVYRQRDTQDGRVMRIYLTDQGKEIEASVRSIWKDHQTTLLASISAEEKIFLNELLARMEKNLS